jgi:thiol-disulfide isomerase/thioredoxin
MSARFRAHMGCVRLRTMEHGMNPLFRCIPLAALLFALPVFAQDTAAPAPNAREVVQKAMTYVAGANSVSVDLTIGLDAVMNGQPHKNAINGQIVLKGADKTFLHIGNDVSAADLFCDGKKKFVHMITDKQYAEEDAAPRKALIGLMGGGPTQLGSVWLGKFLDNDASLFTEISDASYVGVEKQNDENGKEETLQHLRISTSKWVQDVWLKDGPQPLLRKFRCDLARTFGNLASGDSMAIEFKFTHWELNSEAPDARFQFTPPEGVTKFVPTNGAQGDSMIGKAAPALSLDVLGGGKLDLAELKGKKIVILDFWATWCGPCRMAMPVVAEVAKEYAAKDVVLYAVNLREPEEKVKAFLEHSGLDVKIALDREGDAGVHYGADSIPRMVIIDKESVVRAAHKGMGPNFRDDLKSELDAIIAGKAAATSGK